MLSIRKAKEEDKQVIYKILEEVDEQTSQMDYNDFLVAEKDNEIIGAVKLRGFDGLYFLSSLSVKPNFQKKGIAREIMEHILKGMNKDIYIYTVLPEFFRKFGFKEVSPPGNLPSKSPMECERCYPEKCVCMVRRGK